MSIMHSGAYTYFAFICYSRCDIREAARLQSDLESFRIPIGISLPEGLPRVSHIRPIARDKTDLDVNPSPFWDDIQQRISASRFLIVLCSRDSAKSPYVDREARHFLASRPDAHASVLPVVVSGTPNAASSEEECLPPALREAGAPFADRNLPTFVDSTREEVLLQVVAFLLNVSYATINDRHQKQKQRQLRRLVGASLAVAVTLGVLAAYALVQRGEAVRQRGQAEQKAAAAKINEDKAALSARQAKMQLAENLISTGDVLSLQDRTLDARSKYLGALDIENELRILPVRVELALSSSYLKHPSSMLWMSTEASQVPLRYCIAPDNRSVISLNADGTVLRRDLLTGATLKSFMALPEITNHGKIPNQMARAELAVLPDGKSAIIGGYKGLALWDLERGTLVREFVELGRFAYAKVLPGGGGAVCSGENDDLTVISLPDGAKVRTIKTGVGGVYDLSVSGDGRVVGIASLSHLQFHDIATGAVIKSYPEEAAFGCALNQDGTKALSADFEGGFTYWDLTGRAKPRREREGIPKARRVAFDPTCRLGLVQLTPDTTAMINLLTWKVTRTFYGGLAACTTDGSVVVTQNGQHLMTWDAKRVQRERRTWYAGGEIDLAALAPDGRLAMTLNKDHSLRMWDVGTGRLLKSYPFGTGTYRQLAFSPRAPFAIMIQSTSGEPERHAALVIDLRTGASRSVPLGNFYDLGDGSIAVCDDGRTMVYSTVVPDAKPERIKFGIEGVDLETGVSLYQFKADDVRYLALLPGDAGACSGKDRIYIFDARTGAVQRELKTERGEDRIYGIFAADNRYLFTASMMPNTLTLWDLKTGSVVRSVPLPGKMCSSFNALGGPNSPILLHDDEDIGGGIKCIDPKTGDTIWSPLGGGLDSAFEVRAARHASVIMSSGKPKNVIAVDDISRVAIFLELREKVEAAQKALATKPEDAGALATIAGWYSFLGRNDWAIELFERSHHQWQDTNPVLIARAYWAGPSSETPGLPTPEQCRATAQEAFRLARQASTDPWEQLWLELCGEAVQPKGN